MIAYYHHNNNLISYYYVICFVEPKVVAHVQVKEELSPRAEKEMILKVEESIKENTAIKEVSVHFLLYFILLYTASLQVTIIGTRYIFS